MCIKLVTTIYYCHFISYSTSISNLSIYLTLCLGYPQNNPAYPPQQAPQGMYPGQQQPVLGQQQVPQGGGYPGQQQVPQGGYPGQQQQAYPSQQPYPGQQSFSAYPPKVAPPQRAQAPYNPG